MLEKRAGDGSLFCYAEVMNIHWNKVTRVSQLVSIVLFVGVFLLGIVLGMEYEKRAFTNALEAQTAGVL